MRYQPLPASFYQTTRQNLRLLLPPRSVAIFLANDTMPTNADGTMRYKQNSDLFYLAGTDQEETILVICHEPVSDKWEEVLFLRETNEHIAVWEGDKLTKEQAREQTGIQNVQWLQNFDSFLQSLMTETEHVYLNINEHTRRSTSGLQGRNRRFVDECRNRFPLHQYHRAAPLMHQLRSIKLNNEVEAIQQACNITEQGFRKVLNFVKPGVMEYEIEAEYIYEFVRNGSRGFAYEPIVASGSSACVLHYIENNKACRPGELILMDVGAEYGNYNADMTRCIPVDGTFTPRQKEVYNAVLDVMKQAIQLLRPGKTHKDYTDEVGLMVQEKLIKMGLLTQKEIDNQDPEKPLYRKYFMHGVSHYLGLDVHDVGSFYRPFEAGMVFTCEPGIYIREEGIGIRLENNILITENEPIDLMKNIPVEADEIEALMKQGR